MKEEKATRTNRYHHESRTHKERHRCQRDFNGVFVSPVLESDMYRYKIQPFLRRLQIPPRRLLYLPRTSPDLIRTSTSLSHSLPLIHKIMSPTVFDDQELMKLASLLIKDTAYATDPDLLALYQNFVIIGIETLFNFNEEYKKALWRGYSRGGLEDSNTLRSIQQAIINSIDERAYAPANHTYSLLVNHLRTLINGHNASAKMKYTRMFSTDALIGRLLYYSPSRSIYDFMIPRTPATRQAIINSLKVSNARRARNWASPSPSLPDPLLTVDDEFFKRRM